MNVVGQARDYELGAARVVDKLHRELEWHPPGSRFERGATYVEIAFRKIECAEVAWALAAQQLLTWGLAPWT